MRILGIDLSDGDLWLLGLFGACLALLVPHRLAVSRDSRARTAQAVGGFRVAFNTDIAEIANSSRIPDNLVYVHLARRFPVHAVAVSEFGHHLGFFARRRLAKTGPLTPTPSTKYANATMHFPAPLKRRHGESSRLSVFKVSSLMAAKPNLAFQTDRCAAAERGR